MVRAMKGRVALVTGGGKGIGRAVALALAARGVAVVVTGRSERPLGETVGEIANAAGKARHLAENVFNTAHHTKAIARATDELGGLDFVVATAAVATGGAKAIFEDALPHLRAGARIAVVARAPVDANAAFPSAAAHLSAQTFVFDPGLDDDAAAARVASALCGTA